MCNWNGSDATSFFPSILKFLPNGGQLPNGWTYRFSITRTIAVDGKNYENGVKPDYYVILNPNAYNNGIDNVIEFAADKLLENNTK